MGFYQYLSVSIFSILCLISNTLIVEAEDGQLSFHHDGSSCPLSRDCAVTKPYSGNFSLGCKLDRKSNYTLAWFKNNTILESSNRMRISGSDQELFLNFTAVAPEDAGQYHCKLGTKGENDKFISTKELAVDVHVLPYMKILSKNVQVIEENALNLTCEIISSDDTTVIWIVSTGAGNNTYKETYDRVELSAVNNSKNAFFHIKSANLTLDRGKYTCIAKSDFGESPNNATMEVRVKSKFAALWPFLGICAEVIILCTIILIYEKKRNKTEMEESDTDQGPETKSSPDHGQDNVRYRK